MEIQSLIIDSVAKPRMTRCDRWKKRPCVQRYWEYKDKIRRAGLTLPYCGAHVTFYMPMPKSWSKKKKILMCNDPHQNKPDVDNLLKGLMDAIYDDDCRVWDVRVTKVWSVEGEISIK